MMMKQNSDTTTAAAAVACGNCGVDERRLLHHVRHRGSFRRLCTSCVLRLHPHSFCPTCFLVYDHSPPPSTNAVTCFKCYSSSHSQCVGGGGGSTVSSPYVCPPCTNPNAPIFVAKKANKEEGDGRSYREIDKKSAIILLAAVRISAVSMSKAAVAARAEAERRAKEASFTRKRARESLEHAASLVTKEKLKKKEYLSCEISGSGNVTLKDKSINTGGNGGGAAVVKAEQNPIANRPVVDRVDSSNEVLAALSAVELKEKEKERLQVISVAPINCVPMDVENHNRLEVNSISNSVDPNANSDHLDKQNLEGEKVSNGLLSAPSADLMRSGHVKEEKIDPQE